MNPAQAYKMLHYIIMAMSISSMSTLTRSTPVTVSRTDCISAPILAPRQDCEAVVRTLSAQYSAAGADWSRMWGRTILPDDTHVQTPVGFRLSRIFPWIEPNRCEIHIDNTVDRWSRTDVFSMMDVVVAAESILNQCYPSFLTGKAFPVQTRNVYVTTLWTVSDTVRPTNLTIIELGPGSGGSGHDHLLRSIS